MTLGRKPQNLSSGDSPARLLSQPDGTPQWGWGHRGLCRGRTGHPSSKMKIIHRVSGPNKTLQMHSERDSEMGDAGKLGHGKKINF